jgi:hypothetical protein
MNFDILDLIGKRLWLPEKNRDPHKRKRRAAWRTGLPITAAVHLHKYDKRKK